MFDEMYVNVVFVIRCFVQRSELNWGLKNSAL